VILETSFLIDLMKGRPDAVALAQALDRSGESTYLAAPALFELWVGVGRAVRRREETEGAEGLIASFDVMAMTDTDAREAGLLQARLSRKGRTMGTVDIMLAGMSKARGQPLVTGDRSFGGVADEITIRTYRKG